MSQRKSLYAYFFSCLFILSLAVLYPSWNRTGGGATLSWDVMGYYTYLPAGLIYDDFTELKFRDDIQKKYHPTGLDHAGYISENGNQVMKYPMGMAVAYLPWFSLAHLTAKASSYPADGFSVPYQFFIFFGCLIYAFIGLWYFRKILIRYFDDGTVAITLLLMAIGTNYLNYTAFDMAMPHSFLFTLYTILIWKTIQWYESPSWKNSIAIGVCIGWAALARPTEIVAILIPILWGINNWESVKERFQVWKKHFGKILITGCIIGAIGMLQLIYWKMVAGKFLEYSYQDQGFSWNGIHLKNCFFSYRKGWLLYTPLMTFSVIGLFFLWLKNKTNAFPEKIFLAVFLFFLINTYIIFSWDIWWYGGGFGQRAMIPSYALLGFSLAAFLEYVGKNTFTKSIFGIAIAACVGLNIFQTWQAHSPNAGFETENMTKAYYWKIFGKTKTNPEWRIFLDTDEEFLGTPRDLKSIYKNDFESETDSTFFDYKNTTSGTHAVYLNQAQQFSPLFSTPLSASADVDWVQATADFYCKSKEWNFWQMSQFTISLENGDQPIKHKMIRVQRLLTEKNWRRISIVIKVPKGVPFDNVKVKFWNAGGNKELWIDQLEIATFKE